MNVLTPQRFTHTYTHRRLDSSAFDYSDFIAADLFCVLCRADCVSACLHPLLLWKINAAIQSQILSFDSATATVINSLMRLFVVALQSMSYFSICHRYSLLCYLPPCSVVCHLFCFCKIYTVPLCVTQRAAMIWRWYDVQHLTLLSSATIGSMCYISASWPIFISRSMQLSLCSTATGRCISQQIECVTLLRLSWCRAAWGQAFILKSPTRTHMEEFTWLSRLFAKHGASCKKNPNMANQAFI